MVDMNGKTVLVTGATSGIGEIAARELASQGAHVFVHGRDAGKGAATVGRIKATSGSDQVEFVQCDLASLQDIERFAGEFLQRCPRLDVLLNNAGAMHTSRKTTADGFEMTFGVNHLAYFALTLRLLPALKAAEQARVVNVASRAHRMARPDLDDLQAERKYSSWTVYGNSKLFNIWFTRELARKLQGTGVTVNCLHPGVVKTNFALNDEGWMKKAWQLMSSLIAITPEEGAVTSIYLCTSSEVEGMSGGYFDQCKPTRPTKLAQDADLASRLWQVSEELTGLSL